MKFKMTAICKGKVIFEATYRDGDDFATSYMKEIGARLMAEIHHHYWRDGAFVEIVIGQYSEK